MSGDAMKIKTKLRLITIFSTCVALIIGFTLFLTSQEVEKAVDRNKIANEIATGVFELNTITYEYLLSPEERMKEQWQSRHDSLTKLLGEAEFETPENQVLRDRIHQDHESVKMLFSQLVTIHESVNEKETSIEVQERIVGQILVKSQVMISSTSQLAEVSRVEIEAAQQRAGLLLMFFILITATVIGVVSILISRSVVMPVTRLHEGTEIISVGNLDYRVGTATDDEIGQLSRAFDQMTVRLKESFTGLEKEIAERRHAEEEIRRLNKDLERRVVERTAQLTETNKALLLIEKRLEDIIELAPVGIAISTPEGRVIEANSILLKMLGYDSKEEYLKVPASAHYFDPNDRDAWISEFRKKGFIKGFETRFKRRDGTPIWGLFSVIPLTTEEETQFLVAFGDITERKQVEEQIARMNAELEATNKELEAFSYSVSHDLRAPLRGINGFGLALLEDYADRLDEQGRDYLNRVCEASKHMGQLIDDLLKLSRATRSEMKREPVDLSAIAQRIASELQKSQPERRVEFANQEGLTTEGDARLLGIVLENLLSNAWKFTGKQEHARIEFGVEERDGRPAFYMRDNGAGFDMAYVNKLFTPFQRLHAPTEFPGTGIGLATVQRIIHRHGGRVWAEGEVGKGATFYFQIQSTGEGG